MVCLLCQLVCGTGRTTSKWSSTEVFVLSGWSGLVSGTGKMAGCREHPNSRKYYLFDWDHDGVSDHVGIVESCDGTTVYTVEGNPEMRLRRIVIRFIQHLLWDMELFQGCESLYRRGKSI